MKRVLCIADSCCDLIFGGLEALPKPGEERYGTHFSAQAGGGANTPMHLGRLGVPVSFWTVLGKDLMGDIVRRSLRANNVRLIRHGQRYNRTPVSAVLSTDTDRAFASYLESGALIENFAALEKAISRADIVHTYLGYCLQYPIAHLCAQYGKTLSLDCTFSDRESAKAQEALSCCGMLKLNREEALRLSGADTVEEALDALSGSVKGTVVITLGAEGSVGKEHGKEPVRQDALSCGDFVDACGAGDAFMAGLLYGMAQDQGLSACMEHGARLAGICVTHYGGGPENTDGTGE